MDSLKIELKNINPSIANAIRRVIMTEIPVWSLNNFEILENNTPLINEYLINRLKLIPMNNEKPIESTKEFIINAVAKGEGITNVYSHDIKPSGYFRPDMLIAGLKGNDVLGRYEKLHIKMSANQGTHLANGAWYSPITTIEYELFDNDTRCVMTVFSNGTFAASTLLQRGLDVLISKMQQAKTKAEYIKLDDDFFEIKIDSENETLAGLIQSEIIKTYYPKEVSFISANKVHPLENHIIVKMKTELDPKMVLDNTLDSLEKFFGKIKK